MAAFKSIPECKKINGRLVLDLTNHDVGGWDWLDYKGKTGTIYVVACREYHKVGLTKDFTKRFAGICHAIPFPVEKVATRTVPLAGMTYAEAWLHLALAKDKVKGEWFSTPRADILRLLPDAVRRAQVYERAVAAGHASIVAGITEEEAARRRAEGDRIMRAHQEEMFAFYKNQLETPTDVLRRMK